MVNAKFEEKGLTCRIDHRSYSGERFERYFADFQQKYGIADMYSGGFYLELGVGY